MKKILFLLVMLVTAIPAYNQASRRTVNANSNTRSREANSRTTYASTASTNRHSARTGNQSQRTANRQSGHVNRQTHANTNSRRYTDSRATKHHSNRSKHYINHNKGVYHTVTHKYHSPVKVNVIWTADMHHHYVKMYPTHRNWNYRYGYHISGTPAHNADFYIGDVKKVYGRISDICYAHETDEYFLYIGPYFPRQHFTIVIPGPIARNFSHRPESYFMNRKIAVTGLVTSFEGTPEILVKRNFQLNLY